MQIDNSILNIVFATAAFTFAVLYFRAYLNNRFMQMHRTIDDHATDFYREMETQQRRIFALEKCCSKTECKNDKSFYNSNA